MTGLVKADEVALLPARSELATLSPSVQQNEPPKRRKRGPKGPNPLSVKKKKSAVPQPVDPKAKSNAVPTGSKRKHEDEQDDPETSLKTDSGHKRKRRRRVGTEPSTDRDAS